MRGQLKTLVLDSINNSPRSGSQIINYIEQKYNWKPSPGSIYPKLEEIEKEQLAKITQEKKSKIYKITAKGKKQLQKLSNKKEELITTLTKAHSMMQELYGLETGIDQKVLNQIRQDTLPIKDIDKESNQMKKEIFRILTSKNYKKNKTKLKKILIKTNQELKKIK
ncbi:MAG: PadR family transcriptional regulator [Candidatus Woesearchaeota archaeon]